MSRARVAVGLALASAASFILLAPRSRFELAMKELTAGWPYLLGIFAFAAAIVALVEPRRLLGPFVLVSSSLAGLAFKMNQLSGRLVAYWPLAVIAVAALLALGGDRPRIRRHLASIAWTNRCVLRDQLPRTFRVTCVLGGAHIDLRDTALSEDAIMTLTAIIGYIRIKIPAHWPVILDGLPGALVIIDERGCRDKIDPAARPLRLRPGGFAGFLIVERW